MGKKRLSFLESWIDPRFISYNHSFTDSILSPFSSLKYFYLSHKMNISHQKNDILVLILQDHTQLSPRIMSSDQSCM